MDNYQSPTFKSNHKETGKVFLAGAGPGDPELLTIKAQRLLRTADVIYYDWLVSAQIMDMSNPQAEKFFVGKEDGFHTVEQEDINKLLIKSAKEGKTVLRLKGGDPFVFGRGSEEALDLSEAGIDFEIVPGISSALAAPAYAGIPVTHRNLATSFVVITGHLCANNDQAIDYKKFASVDTVIFLMGVKRRACLAQSLIDGGKPAEEPVAFIENGTTFNQKVIVSTLSEVAQGCVKVNAPAIMIVGKVVDISNKISWFQNSRDGFKLSAEEKSLINVLQNDFPLESTPFVSISERLGIDESDVLSQVEILKEKGIVSRIGSIIKPNSIGKSELVAVSVPANKVELVAAYVNSFLEVNHNYEREHEYNLWFVVTALTEERVGEVISEIEKKFEISAMRLPLVEDFHIDLGFSL